MRENIVRDLDFVPLLSINRSTNVRRKIRIHPNHNLFAAAAIS